MDLKKLLTEVKLIAARAAEKVMEVYETNFTIFDKEDNSPLTTADIASNEIICAGLRLLTPDIKIISEENKEIPYESRKNDAYIWSIDPIDGTKEFIKKNGEFAINIALIHNQRVVLGIVGMPAQKAMAYAIKGHGAFYSDQLGVTPLYFDEQLTDPACLRIACSRSHLDAKTKQLVEEKHQGKLEWIPRGSSQKIVIIAQCQADYYLRLGRTMEWDIAAPQIILEEAGGQVLSLSGGLPLVYNKEDLRNPSFEAGYMANPLIQKPNHGLL